MAAPPIISFRDFSFRYHAQKRPTLHDINLDIGAGEKVVIVGPSGSGKSTLGNCLNGLIPFSYGGDISGSLTIAGRLSATASIAERSKIIGTVLQDTDAQFVGLNAGEDIAFSLENDNVPTAAMRAQVAAAAERVGLSAHLRHAPQRLSGGQKQRAALAGVLVDQVDILLFDEPLASLDPHTGKRAIEIIDQLCAADHKTVLIIEHRLEDVLHCAADRIVLIDGGRIVADQPPDAMIRSGLLTQHGLREPLHVSLFRYAGIDIDAVPVARLPRLREDQQQRIRSWFHRSPPAAAPPRSAESVALNAVTFSYDHAPARRRAARTKPAARRPDRTRRRQAARRRAAASDQPVTPAVLHDVSFAAYRQQMIAVVGENGAGKTTACKIICGFEPLRQGSVYIDGADAADDSIAERANKVGYIMQNPNQMITKQTVCDEVALGLQLRHVAPAAVDHRVDEVLAICGLTPLKQYPISALSYGQKKRVTIAAILVLRPQVIILDEPTAGQDYRHYVEIMEFLRTINGELGVTIILITHDMHLMLEYAERALVLSRGRLLADVPAAAVLTDVALSRAASLKETSLYHVARQVGLEPRALVERFIASERATREQQRQ